MSMQTVSTMDADTIAKLQDLIQENLDSANGLSQAAESIEDSNAGATLRRIAADRRVQASELQKFVEFNQEQPEDEGSFGGTMRAKWLKFRGAISGGDAHVVLSQAENLEDHIRNLYEDVLKKTAGSPVNAVLQRQHRVVKGQHDQVRAMRDAVA
jgi:uncharacterized protein (TIGR02284 family)